MTAQQTSDFQADQVTTIAGGHFVHDTYSAFLAPLLPLLKSNLGLSYTLVGSLAVFMQLPSLLNPFIGYLADRISLRYFIILAPAITATLMSSIGLASDYVTLALLLFTTGLSIAAFHAPAPAMIGRVAGPKVGTGMSIFMAAGELARTVGPIVAVAGVSWFGLEGIWRLAVGGWLMSGILYWRLRHISARPSQLRKAPLAEIWPTARHVFPTLIWLMTGRVFMVAALTTYLAIFVRDELGGSLWLAAISLTILEGAGVVGALLSGTLSDRFGRKRVLLVLLGLAPILMLLFLYGPTWLTIASLIGLGLTAISPQPVLLALVQDEFTEHRALANGTFLALSFLIRALGIWLVGMVADHYGMSNAFLFACILAFLSLPAVFFLPPRRRPA
ncbi:MAG TPA: MFS transporter [Caldilineae bacterium]|nr:MFS transporter [Caldilineae bacterium]